MDIKISAGKPVAQASVQVTGSKSETNRLLLLQALYPGISIQNISESDDSIAMQGALASTGHVVDIHHAGTAMRFLTAYFAQSEGRNVLLTGSQRMQERPIGVLVDALRSLGADIEYAGNEGYPPLKITGKKLAGGKASIKADVSSQYITALLLIAGKLENGLELELLGELTSIPYIKMTLGLLDEVGIENSFEGNVITVQPTTNNQESEIVVESDWSSASYFYSIVALSEVGTSITLSSYKENSLQGDSALATLYKDFGVSTIYGDNAITLTREGQQLTTINHELNNTPDIAQTIAVTCFALGIGCHLTGLHTLKIKETDRLEALKTELGKFGAEVEVTNDSLTLAPSSHKNKGVEVTTYNDHRMAMAFAPLALKVPIVVKDAGVVSKSFPTFWEDMEKMGFVVSG
ncbi:MAG: 3-phosphoshikimate 1-carboxyvinyltransferase [Bacteroidia bacterium]